MVLVWLCAFALFLWILSLILDLILPRVSAPAQAKPIILGIVCLAALIYAFTSGLPGFRGGL